MTDSSVNILKLERFGLLAMRAPRLFAFVVVILLAGSVAVIILRLEFSGDTAQALRGSSQYSREFDRLESAFARFSTEKVILVRSPALNTAAGFEKLRELHLELQLLDPIETVTSIFSITDRDAVSGKWRSPVPASISDSRELERVLDSVLRRHPIAKAMISRKQAAALLVIKPAPKYATSDGQLRTKAWAELEEVLKRYRSAGFAISIAGRSELQRAIIDALVRDQIVLTLLALLLSALIASAIFRSVTGAVMCTLPPIVAVLIYLGLLSLLSIKIDFMNTVIPVLVIVFAFADSLHLYFRWRKLCEQGVASTDAMRQTVLLVGPACGLAAATTAIAFLALIASSNDAIIRMALVGAMGVGVSFFVVMAAVPVLGLWFGKRRIKFAASRSRLLDAAAPIGVTVLKRRPRVAIGASMAVALVLLVPHFSLPANYRATDYLPTASEVREAEAFISRVFRGSGQVFAVYKRGHRERHVSAEELVRLRRIQSILEKHLGPGRTASLASIDADASQAPKPIDLAPFGNRDARLLFRFVSADRSQLLVSAFVPLSIGALEMRPKLREIERDLSRAGLAKSITLTGFPVLSAREHPTLMTNLRQGLLISVILSVFVIGLAFRSGRLGLACLVPNVLPILFVESLLWLIYGEIEITGAITLTIGFGIAVNDSVHLLNHYQDRRREHDAPIVAMEKALRSVSPALVATTVILSAVMMLGLVSALPTVWLFAWLVIAVLSFALLADILTLPSIATALDRSRRSRKTSQT